MLGSTDDGGRVGATVARGDDADGMVGTPGDASASVDGGEIDARALVEAATFDLGSIVSASRGASTHPTITSASKATLTSHHR
jgi:hypothetical protein